MTQKIELNAAFHLHFKKKIKLHSLSTAHDNQTLSFFQDFPNEALNIQL